MPHSCRAGRFMSDLRYFALYYALFIVTYPTHLPLAPFTLNMSPLPPLCHHMQHKRIIDASFVAQTYLITNLGKICKTCNRKPAFWCTPFLRAIMESSRGIQQLMEAEQSATKIVQEMREGKFQLNSSGRYLNSLQKSGLRPRVRTTNPRALFSSPQPKSSA